MFNSSHKININNNKDYNNRDINNNHYMFSILQLVSFITALGEIYTRVIPMIGNCMEIT